MNISLTSFDFKKLKSFADWKLLLFLLLFLNVKLAIKIPAIALMYLLQFDFKFGFSFKNSRLPLFYPLIIGIAIIGFVCYGGYAVHNYPPVLVTGIVFWVLCILAVHQVKLSVEKNDIETLHNTLLIFFIINALISFLNLAIIIREIRDINPYTYQGQYQKYFLGTGDYIKGLTFDTSITNAITNAFGVVYFFVRKKPVMLLLCMAVLLLTGSNFTNVAILLVLISLFIFKSNRDQKSMVVVCLLFFVVFMAKISPQNNRYVVATFKKLIHAKAEYIKPDTLALRLTLRPDSVLTWEERRQKLTMLYLDSVTIAKKIKQNIPRSKRALFITDAGEIFVPKPDLNAGYYQNSKTTPAAQISLLKFIKAHKTELKLAANGNPGPSPPGKITGMVQTLTFLKNHPGKILTGDGVGNFSSKLAFKATGLGVTGSYPAKYVYINPDFEINHLDVYLLFFSKQGDYHSLINSPFSVYDQMLSEYGLLGLAGLFVAYLWFFAQHYKQLTYGIPILILMMLFFFIDYWFEQLSIIILFELMLFLNIKEGKNLINHAK